MKRTLAVLAAVVLALLGAGSVMAYASSADQRALAGQRAVEVFVTTDVVPAGTTASEAVSAGLLQRTLIASKGVPAGVLTEVDDSSEEVATTDIAAGEIVLARRFGTERAASAALVVPEGQVAITVELSDPGRVSAFLRPGSDIVVYDTFTARDAEGGEFVPSGVGLSGEPGSVNATRVLLPAAEVLAVGAVTMTGQPPPPGAQEGDQQTGGTAAAPAPEEAVPTALVTVAVSPADGQRLVHAAQTGTLYAGLLGENADVGNLTVEDRQLFTSP